MNHHLALVITMQVFVKNFILSSVTVTRKVKYFSKATGPLCSVFFNGEIAELIIDNNKHDNYDIYTQMILIYSLQLR